LQTKSTATGKSKGKGEKAKRGAVKKVGKEKKTATNGEGKQQKNKGVLKEPSHAKFRWARREGAMLH